MTERAPLRGLRVLDVTDRYGAYAGRLLADLGATVTRVRLDDGGPVWPEPSATGVGSTHTLFTDAGKVVVDPSDLTPEMWRALVEQSDVILEAEGAVGRLGLDPDDVIASTSGAVRVTISPFGRGENPSGPVDDLIVLGAGGLLHLGGYRDVGPVGAWGGQSTMASGIFGAAAAIVGLLTRTDTGSGLTVDVSAQECVAQALEDSVAEYSLLGRVRGRRGIEAREAGTGTYACADGWVSMVAGRLGTARAWAALVAWMNASGTPGTDELAREPWSDFGYRRTAGAIARFDEVFQGFAATRTREALYLEAQERGIALSPVNDIDGVLADRQLAAREFFIPVEVPGGGVATFPGPPYRLSATPPLAPVAPRHTAPLSGTTPAGGNE